MTDSISESLLNTHRIERGNTHYKIYLNKPDDFIYDISEIIIIFNPSDNSKVILCDEIPENIKKNIYKFNFLKIDDFIDVFEKNINLFFSGKIPELKLDEKEQVGDGELPSTFKFPIHNNVSSNIRCDIYKERILLFCCLTPNLVVKCNKCDEVMNISSNSSCKKCGQGIGFVYVPTIESDNLGFLQPKKASFVCFNPGKYQFSCADCGKAYESGQVGIGDVYSRKCTGCFKEIKFKINKIEYFAKREVKIKEGEELPEKGTCKHYKKSYRWFRFSCCNSLYPCDICHDEQTGHRSEIANKMVCGFCSKEQSVKSECDCGMNLKKKHSQFWEGGKGNRDKLTMNRKDSKKYR